uniref:Polyamine modulated factor 1 n=1 Tax=Podarcis muralis TaxID=64176 RepID=A0A670II06_PODMU
EIVPQKSCSSGTAAPPSNPSLEQLLDYIVDVSLRKIVEAGSYHRFAKCYSHLYKAQPELTKCVYNQLISHLQTSFREEIQDLKEEGNLSVLFKSLDELAEEEDIHSAVVPYLLKQHRFLQKAIKEKEEANSWLAEAVLAGRKRIADLQEEIRKSKEEWQAVAQEGQQIVSSLDEL